MSSVVMSFPLFAIMGYIILSTPFAANPELVNPATFQYMTRAALRLLSLNMAFIGGIHYGLGAAMYEIAMSDKDLKFNKYQMLYAFVPAAMAFSTTSILLFASPLAIKHVVFAFTSLMLTQLITLQFDKNCVDRGMAP